MKLDNITLGQYLPGSSPVHRLDPRTKILLMVGYIVAIFLIKYISVFALAVIFTLIAALLARVPVSYLIKSLRPMRWLLPIMFIMNLLMVKTGKLLVSWWIFKIYGDGIYSAFFLVLRVTTLVAGTSLLTLTTTPVALTDALELMLSPLKRIKFPAHELAMMMTIALRFIPTLIEEADKIMKAQLARGADFESGNILRRAKAMLPVLIPLFVNSFRRADELAMAMESRCYHGGEGRTRMRVLRFALGDLWAALIVAAFIGLILIIQHFIPRGL